jgi:membrane associated rhomboid family serine protease
VLPLRDHNPTRSKPYVNYALLVANLMAFLWQSSLIQAGAAWVAPGYGVVPTRLAADPLGEGFTIVTSMFLHGGWMHLGGNMLFLYIFGDNVEDAIGHYRYLFFYLLSGVGAALAQVFIDPSSTIPMVGASGAIAGVLGAYLVLYPRAPITVWFGFILLVVPAWLVVGEWFLWNLVGAGSLDAQGGGVAFFAHLGGFVAGMLIIRPALTGRQRVIAERWQGWRTPPKQRPPWDERWQAPRPRSGPWDPWK